MSSQICFVTAFKELKRSGSFSTDGYIHNFLKLANYIEYDLFVYAEKPIIEKIFTVQKTFPTNITFMSMENVTDAFIYKYFERDSKILKSEQYLKLIPEYRNHLPEHNDIGYNLINHSKINFIQYTQSLKSNYTFYSWIDFGRFNENTNNIPSDVDIKKLPDTKLVFQCPHGPWFSKDRIMPNDMLQQNTIFILGASFVIPATMITTVHKLYEDKILELYSDNITDDDQSIWIQLFWDNPNIFLIINDDMFYNMFSNLKIKKTSSISVWSNSTSRFEDVNLNQRIHFVTVSTSQNNILDIIQKRVNEFGNTLTVLTNPGGGHDPVKTIIQNGETIIIRRFKIDLLIQYLKSDFLRDDDIILFTDAYDVMIQSSLEEIKDLFINNFKKPIVFSAEASCYPDGSLSDKFPKTSLSGNNFLNSGMFIGKVFALRSVLQTVNSELQITCDQLWWSHTFLNNQHLIELDYESLLFRNLVWIKPDELVTKDNVVFFKENKSPVIHGNGPAKKTFYLTCIKHLVNHYKLSDAIHEEIKNELQLYNGWP